MLEKKLISKLPDLYKLTPESFLKLDKVKEKLAVKMYENIQKSKLNTWLTSEVLLEMRAYLLPRVKKLFKMALKP